MRPIDIDWDTSEMVTLEFSPRKLLYRRIVRTMFCVMLVQAVISCLFLIVLQSAWLADLGFRPTRIPGIPIAPEVLIASCVSFLLVAAVTMPLFTRMVSRQTASMRELLEAIRRIAEGGQPKPVTVRDNGEMGYLMTAFNDMASRLIAGRQALLDANARLEKRVSDRTKQLEQAAKKLDHMASTDILTGLANRRAWSIEMERRFTDSVRHESELICIAIDLDGLKAVNDALGQKLGDSMLQAASQAITANLRDSDFSARLGGDEFVVMLSLDKLNVAESIAKRIGAKFQELCVKVISDIADAAAPTMSFGLATRITTAAHCAEELLNFADHALHAAKGAGKGCLRVYEAPSAAA